MNGLVLSCERSGSGDSSSFDDHLFIPPSPLILEGELEEFKTIFSLSIPFINGYSMLLRIDAV